MMRKFIALLILFSFALTHCDGGTSDTPEIDTAGSLTALATVEEILVDQFAFYLNDEEFSSVDFEIWIKDVESGEIILCTSALGGMTTEAIIYGNLDARFQKLITDTSYEGSLFQVKGYINYKTPCKNDDEDKGIGHSAIVNFASLTSKPLVATNGKFYVRIKADDGVGALPLPQVVSSLIPADTLQIDQVHVESTVDLDDTDGEPDVEVHIVNADSGEMIGCAENSEGLTPVDELGLTYGRLLADIIDVDGSVFDFSDHEVENVQVIIADNTGTACPQTLNDSDQVLGTSATVVWNDLPGSEIPVLDGDGNQTGFVTFSYLLE